MLGGKPALETRIAAAVAYFFPLLGLVFVFTRWRENYFLRYHGCQGVAWGVFLLFFWLVLQLILFITSRIPLLGSLLGFFSKVLYLAAFLATAYFFYLTLQGEKFKIPLIYDLFDSR